MKKSVAVIILVAVAIIGFGGYMLLTNDESEETIDQAQQADTTESVSDTTPVNLPDRDGFYAVSLENLQASFYVQNDVEEVDDITVYRRFPNPSECEFVGQQGKTLLVLAAETGSDCVDLSEFNQSEARSVQLENTEIALSVYALGGNSGDQLLAEQADLDNNVTLSFLYKNQFSSEVQDDIESVLGSFEARSTE